MLLSIIFNLTQILTIFAFTLRLANIIFIAKKINTILMNAINATSDLTNRTIQIKETAKIAMIVVMIKIIIVINVIEKEEISISNSLRS